MAFTSTRTEAAPRGWEAAADVRAAARRVLVLGPSGAGKTHFAARLARLLELEVIHLDAYFWRPGWVPTPVGAWRDLLRGLVGRPAWVMDGTYENSLDLRIPAADTIIVLERARLACLWGVLRRCLLRPEPGRVDAPPGQKLDRAFLKYVWRYTKQTRPLIFRLVEQLGPDKRLVILRGRRAARKFLEHLRPPAMLS